MNRKAAIIYQQAIKGKLGTPENPDRSNSLHARFWEGYFGCRAISDYPKGSAAANAARAGMAYSRHVQPPTTGDNDQ